jgi:hypothetical protein
MNSERENNYKHKILNIQNKYQNLYQKNKQEKLEIKKILFDLEEKHNKYIELEILNSQLENEIINLKENLNEEIKRNKGNENNKF